jgi:hypothetical protein
MAMINFDDHLQLTDLIYENLGRGNGLLSGELETLIEKHNQIINRLESELKKQIEHEDELNKEVYGDE